MSEAAALVPPDKLELTACVQDNVRGLSRVLNVLALLDITPLELAAVQRSGELEVTARLRPDAPRVDLGVERLRALPCVRRVQLSAD